MAETINIPGLGHTKKETAYLLGGVLVVVVGVAIYRSRHGSGGSGSGGGSPQIDPSTGYPAGSAEDQAALAAQAAQAQTQASVGSYGGGYTGGPNYGGSGDGTPPQGYTTNAAWSQAAEEYLVQTVHSGQNADVIGNALGKYITGQPLSPDQVTIVQEAIAFAGYPPVNGPNGNPPHYLTAQTPPIGGGGGGTGGGSGTPGSKLHAPGGLHVSNVARTSVTLTWSRVPNALGYRVWQHGFGSDVGEASGTTFVVHNLRPHTHYTFHVTALGHDGRDGPSSHTVSVTTKR